MGSLASRVERAARHVAYIAFFAMILGLLERYGSTAKAFAAGISIGLVIGSVSVVFFLAKDPESDEEKPVEKNKEKNPKV